MVLVRAASWKAGQSERQPRQAHRHGEVPLLALGVQQCPVHPPMPGSGWEAGSAHRTTALHTWPELPPWVWGGRGPWSALLGDRERLSGRGGVGRSLVQVMVLVLLRWVRGRGRPGPRRRLGAGSGRAVTLSVQKTTSPESCLFAVRKRVSATWTASEWPSARPEDLVPWASSPRDGSHGPYVTTSYTSGSASSPERHRKLPDVPASCPAPSMPGGHRACTNTSRLVKTEDILESATPAEGHR